MQISFAALSCSNLAVWCTKRVKSGGTGAPLFFTGAPVKFTGGPLNITGAPLYFTGTPLYLPVDC